MKTLQHTSKGFTILIILSVLTFLSLNSSFAQSGWYKLTSGTVSDLNAVFFLNAQTGWTVGNNKILKTINGGNNWFSQEFPFSENDDYTFKSVCFTNSTTGWIAGDLYKSPPGVHYRIILKTTNGGETWTESYVNNNSGLNSICYRTPDAGYSVGLNAIIKSTNQGLTWTEQDFPKGENDDVTFNSICFNNPSTGWAAGDVYVNPPGVHQKIIYKTENGGANWEVVYRSGEIGLNCVNFCNTVNGWAVSDCEILSSHNGGANWIIQKQLGGLNTYYYLKSVFFVNASIGWVAGGILRTFGPGYSNVLFKTTNEGSNWTEQTFPANAGNYRLNSVFFLNETTGWSVGDGGVIFKTTDGGTTDIKYKSKILPDSYSLEQNYPNPFNQSTMFNVQCSMAGIVQVKVFDITGREVATLVNEYLQPGTYEVTFDAVDLTSGVYFYKLTAEDFTDTKRMILIK